MNFEKKLYNEHRKKIWKKGSFFPVTYTQQEKNAEYDLIKAFLIKKPKDIEHLYDIAEHVYFAYIDYLGIEEKCIEHDVSVNYSQDTEYGSDIYYQIEDYLVEKWGLNESR